MFAIFHYHSALNWSNLPESLTQAPQMSLDIQCTSCEYDPDDINNLCDEDTDTPPTTISESTNIPVHRTNSTNSQAD